MMRIFFLCVAVALWPLPAFADDDDYDEYDAPVLLQPVIPGMEDVVYAPPSVRPARVYGDPAETETAGATSEAVADPLVVAPPVVQSPAESVTTIRRPGDALLPPSGVIAAGADERLARIFDSGWNRSEPGTARNRWAVEEPAEPAVEAPAVEAASTALPAVSRPKRFSGAERVRILSDALREHDGGKYRESEFLLLPLIESDPTDAMALTLQGANLMKRGMFRDAASIYRSYTVSYPLDAKGHFRLGLAEQRLGDYRGAVDSYWTALLLDPGMREAQVNRAQILQSGILNRTPVE